MRKLKWNRKLSILVLIMFITVTFASFNTNLFINGNAYVRVDRDIRITNIHLLETEYNGYENTNSEYTNRTISTDVSLPRQASSLTYEVTISNVSDKRYKITDIIEDLYDNPDVKYELIDASIGNIVEPHTTKTFRVKFTNNTTVVEEDDVYETKTYTFDYTGDVQEFVAPFTGTYKVELWGGGGKSCDGTPARGAYTSGNINLTKGKKLYVNVGAKYSTLRNATVFNSGTTSSHGLNGGGSTDIRFIGGKWDNFDSLKTRIMVAAGAGVSLEHINCRYAGSGGGLVGYPGGGSGAGSQYAVGSTPYVTYGSRFGVANDACSGGNGYYPGGGAMCGNGSGGGSSFISGHAGCLAINGNSTENNITLKNGCTNSSTSVECSTHYSNMVFSNTRMVDGNGYEWTSEVGTEVVGMPTFDGLSTMTGNDENGHAKITITRKIEDGSEYDYDYTGEEKIFTAPYTGEYQLETWGAQGGNVRIYTGGYGGYSKGLIKLGKNQNLYINVGGQGIGTDGDLEGPGAGGYNGGGTSSSKNSGDAGSGGGATHIALETGLLNTFENKRDKLLIVSGGGGGSAGYNWNASNYGANGGPGGGFNGVNTPGKSVISASYGGTQDSGGVITNTTTSSILTTTSGTFGLGGSGSNNFGSASGGGGYYGGSGCYTPQGYGACGGGGGSGYIGNSLLYDKAMYCYKCDETSDAGKRTISTNSHSILAKQNVAKEGNGFSRITLLKRTINQTKLTLDFTFEEYVNGNEYTFGYTGSEQTFTAPKTGYYQIELWGAQGGGDNGGAGAYTKGTIKLDSGSNLYVYVGEKGKANETNEAVPKSFNGGGQACGGATSGCASGGGATDVRLLSGNWNDVSGLSSRIMVAAGGGGATNNNNTKSGGSGGGLVGYNSSTQNTNNTNSCYAIGGGQTSGGYSTCYNSDILKGKFGIGGYWNNDNGSGGGGYYGGASGYGYHSTGAGGSSYISGHTGSVAIASESNLTPRNDSNGNQCADGTTDNTCSKHYSNYMFTDTKMIDGNGYEWTSDVSDVVVGMPTYDGLSTMSGNNDNGFAKITLIEEVPEYTFDYTGDVQEFIAPYKGIYKVELWGASGGGSTVSIAGGKGAYTSGNIELKKNEKLYVYVGEYPSLTSGMCYEQNENTSFNGGIVGSCAGGGGATDVRLKKGENWTELTSLTSRIMVAAGGGGAVYPGNGGAGGGLTGYPGVGLSASASSNPNYVVGQGGTQVGSSFGVGTSTTSTGGGGFYGGEDGIGGNGGGGSSYISGYKGCIAVTSNSDTTSKCQVSNDQDIACSYHYSDHIFTDTLMLDGTENLPTFDGRTTMVGNTGNGYAKITLVEKIDTYNINYDLDGGTLKNKRNTYSTFDDDITLNIPVKEGYSFTGWTGGVNILNTLLFEDNKYQNYDANVATWNWKLSNNTSCSVSGLQKIKPNTKYIANFVVTGAFYDKDKNVLEGKSIHASRINDHSFISPSDAEYVMFNFWGQHELDNLNYYLEEGTQISSSELYNSNLSNNVVIQKGSKGNRTYTAHWNKETDKNIRYNWNYNMVKNGDFTQTGDDFGWYAVNEATVNMDDTVLYNGQPSYHIYSSTTDWSGADTEFVDVEDGYPPCGHNYNFSISVYKDSTHELGGVNQQIRLYFTYHANDTGTYYPGITDSTIMDGLIDGQWVTYSKDVVVPYAEDYSQNGVFRLDCHKNKVTNNFWVADVNLKIVDMDTKLYNSTISTLPTPTRYGYTFKGWYTQPSGGTKINKGYVVTEDIEMYAHWQKNS